MEHLKNSVVKFSEVARSQEEKGIKKYGKPLDPLDENYDWLDMALEEQVDGTKYLIAEMEKRKYVVKQLKELISDEGLSDALLNCIHHYLNILEGK